MKKIIVLLMGLITQVVVSQNEPSVNVSGFLDVYYAYDLEEPSGNRQPFLYNHNRHNEFNINLGLVRLSLEAEKYRSTVALQTGTYANDNYSAEPGLLKNVFEATIGVSLNKKNNLWLDAGVLPSHIGFESAISTNNHTLSRSLSAENSPYFLSGAKLTYSPNDRWEFAGLVTNGWQRIQRVEGNSMVSVGTQVIYTPNDNVLLNWSTFVGTDDADVNRRMRYFNNVYGEFGLTSNLTLLTGFDIGLQQKHKDSSSYDYWVAPTIIGYADLSDEVGMGLRAEFYNDPYGVIVYEEFDIYGFSYNIDYNIQPNVMFRVESRYLSNSDFVFLTSMAINL
jgi:hypothetical protein